MDYAAFEKICKENGATPTALSALAFRTVWLAASMFPPFPHLRTVFPTRRALFHILFFLGLKVMCNYKNEAK